MKKILAILLCSALASPASAAINAINYPGLKVTFPDTPASVEAIAGVCDPLSVLIDNNNPAAPIFYYMGNCSTTPTLTQFYPPLASTVQGLNTAAVSAVTGQNISIFNNDSGYITNAILTSYLTSSSAAATYYAKPTGTTSQYIRGDGTLATFPAAASRTFNYPSRTINTCFQVSATQDADVNYSVDVNIILSLGGGNAVLTSYTNSGCTTGAQALVNGAVSNVAIGGTASIPLHAIAKSGTWLKVTAATAGGLGSTAVLDAVQAETLLP